MRCPVLNERERARLDNLVPSFWSWWQQFRSFIDSRLATQGDVTLDTKGRGIVMTNAAGTVTKRVRLNDAGNGLIYEDI